RCSSRTKQIFGKTCSFSCGTCPKTRTEPEVGQSCAVITDINVVLPAPLRPSSPWILSFSKFSVTSSRARVSLKRRVRPCASIALTLISVAGVFMVSPRLGIITVANHRQNRFGFESNCPCFCQQGVDVALCELFDSFAANNLLG